MLARLGPGRVLDVGCGVGLETARLDAPDRRVVGIDYDSETAVLAGEEWGPGGPRGTDVEFAAMDGARLGFQTGSFDCVCSSHIIEHFIGPELHVAELARVSTDDGTTFVITPNRPADFENPFHVYLFEAAELASMLRLFFDDVEIWGLEGDEELKADFAARRKSGERILKLDVLNLRQRMPRSWYVWSYEHALPVVYKVLGSENERRRLRPRPHALLDDRRRRAHHAGALRHRPQAPALPGALSAERVHRGHRDAPGHPVTRLPGAGRC